MVGAADYCDPWLEAEFASTTPSTYTCFVLPEKCLHDDFNGIPKLDCVFQAAQAEAGPDELLVFINRDIVVTTSFTAALLNLYDSLDKGGGAAPGSMPLPQRANFLLVGQSIDTNLKLDQISSVYTVDDLSSYSSAPLPEPGHHGFGIDFFAFPKHLFPQAFSAFLLGGFRYDNALVASFIIGGARVIDITKTIPLLRPGIAPADTDINVTRQGAMYNDALAQSHYDKSYVLGGITNAQFLHMYDAMTGTYTVLPSHIQTDEAYLRAFQRASSMARKPDQTKMGEGDTQHAKFLLLVKVPSQDDGSMIWARKWIAGTAAASASNPFRHFIFLTDNWEFFEALEREEPGCVMFQEDARYDDPLLAISWHMLWKLQTNKIAAALTDVQDFGLLFAGESSKAEGGPWDADCDVVLTKAGDGIVGIRSMMGLSFYETFRECHSAKGRVALLQQRPTLFDQDDQVTTSLSRRECLAKLMAQTMDTRALRKTDAKHNDEVIKTCQVTEDSLVTNKTDAATSTVVQAFRSASQPYDIVKETLRTTNPLADKLQMILSISNPAGYSSRYSLARSFIKRIEMYDLAHVALYVVELVYGNQTFNVTSADNPHHLQVRTAVPLWHKENLLNLGVTRLFPEDWKAMAWIDAEIELESPTWALDTLKILNGSRDVVQLFSHGVDLDQRGRTVKVYTGFGYNFLKGVPYQKTGIDMWHPGYGWACTRQAYEQAGGLFEGNILGGSDQSTAYAVMGMHAELPDTLKIFPSPGYRKAILEWEARFQGLRMGYVPGVAKHQYHGSVKNRQYWERRDLLSDVAFDPLQHVQRDNETGVLVPTARFPSMLKVKILEYFQSRREDESEGADDKRDVLTELIPAKKESNPVRDAILHNPPIDDTLHVLVLVYPPTFQDGENRSKHAQDTAYYHLLVADHLNRLTSDTVAGDARYSTYYIVELAHGEGSEEFRHTRANNPTHLQLRLPIRGVWSKGNILNLAIHRLLPSGWQAFAHVDVGCELESTTWALHALQLLQDGSYDVVQLFSHAVMLDYWGNTTRISTGFGYNHVLGKRFESSRESPDYWYTGLAWAYSRRVLEAAGGRFLESDIAGQHDDLQAWSLLGRHLKTINASTSSHGETRNALFPYLSDVHRDAILEYEAKWQTGQQKIGLGYVPGVSRVFEGMLSGGKGEGQDETGSTIYHDKPAKTPKLFSHLREAVFQPQRDLLKDENGIVYPSLTVANIFSSEHN
jgi:hypothetical protein